MTAHEKKNISFEPRVSSAGVCAWSVVARKADFGLASFVDR